MTTYLKTDIRKKWTRSEVKKLLVEQEVRLIPLGFKSKKPEGGFYWKKFQNEAFTGDIPDKNNFGILCGRPSNGIVVVDLDDKRLIQYFEEYLKLTLVVKTKKGWHIYFRIGGVLPNTLRLLNKNGSKVDVQSTGTFVVGPTSIHPEDLEYEIISDVVTIAEIDFKIISKKLTELGFSPDASKLSIKEIEKGVPEGMRDFLGFHYARYLFKQGLDHNAVLEQMLQWNSKNQPPLEVELVEKLVAQAPKYLNNKKFSCQSIKSILNPDGNLTHTDYANEIMNTYHFCTIPETNNLLVYRGGVYHYDGDILVKEECEKRIPNCTTYMCREVLETIKRLTFRSIKEFNSYPTLLNVKNGLVDILTGTITSHSPEKLFTTQLAVKLDPSARPVRFIRFLQECHPDPKDRLDIIEQMASILVPHLKLEKGYLWNGKGDNGKSTLCHFIESLIGEENVSNISFQDLTNHRFLPAELSGKLVNIFADISSNQIQNFGKIKPLISGDGISAEKKGGQPFKLRNSARMIFSTNELPSINEDNYGTFKRFMITNWRVQHQNKNPRLVEELTTSDELSGVLNLLLHHARRLLSNGRFTNEQSAKQVRTQWKQRQEPLDIFIDRCILVKPNAVVPKTELYENYSQWCKDNEYQSVGRNTFHNHIHETLHVREDTPKLDSKSTRAWRGICLSSNGECGNRVNCGKQGDDNV